LYKSQHIGRKRLSTFIVCKTLVGSLPKQNGQLYLKTPPPKPYIHWGLEVLDMQVRWSGRLAVQTSSHRFAENHPNYRTASDHLLGIAGRLDCKQDTGKDSCREYCWEHEGDSLRSRGLRNARKDRDPKKERSKKFRSYRAKKAK